MLLFLWAMGGVDGVVASAVHGMLSEVGAWCWVHHCGDKKVVG